MVLHKNLVALGLVLSVLVNVGVLLCDGGITSSYVRRMLLGVDMPLDSDVFAVPKGYNAPQQVHITQGDLEGKAVIVSWVTMQEAGSSQVRYWSEKNTQQKKLANGEFVTYKFHNYTSGFIHHCTVANLEYNTKYYYEVGLKNTTRQFWFTTPPQSGPDVAYTFGIIGDIGQTSDSNRTLTHYENNPKKGQAVLYVGDLSYADITSDSSIWDTWGRFTERSVAYQPWIWTSGNHDMDFAPKLGETTLFRPYKLRYPSPHKASNSNDSLYYSIKRASAHIIVLSAYSACGKYTSQYRWLRDELPTVNRTKTPWLIVLVHFPFYTSYDVHYQEADTMRVVFESWFVQYKVDIVFSGHVHAYERSKRFSNIEYNDINGRCTPVKNLSAPVYITVGDGGNKEGLNTEMIKPQPAYSAFREASFGHSILEIKDRYTAVHTWHRNQDGVAVAADSVVLYNRYWKGNESDSK